MDINQTIFKSYDIRGIYPDELNKENAYQIGQGFAAYTKAKEIAVGRDMRVSSPDLFDAFVEGIISQGADVVDLGLIATECLYFTMGHYGYKAAATITASHNPAEYNGIKMLKEGVEVMRGIELGEFIAANDFQLAEKPGQSKSLEVWQEYVNHVFSFVDIAKIKPFRVVVDAGNGMAGKMIPFLQGKLPIELIPINFALDGNFPAHPSNPLLPGATEQVQTEVLARGADFGFIFDGDADRVFLIDELGKFVRADVTLLFLAKYFLEKEPGSAIVYNTICSKAVPFFIEQWEGKPIRTKVGAVNVKEAMMLHKSVMGGEVSGHYNFKGNFYSDSGAIAFLTLLQIISSQEKKVSELAAEFTPYAKESEINFEVQNREQIVEKVKKRYTDGKQDYLDGVTVEYPSWWFNVRPSNTEPLIRLTIEADTKEFLEEKKKELTALIQEESK